MKMKWSACIIALMTAALVLSACGSKDETDKTVATDVTNATDVTPEQSEGITEHEETPVYTFGGEGVVMDNDENDDQNAAEPSTSVASDSNSSTGSNSSTDSNSSTGSNSSTDSNGSTGSESNQGSASSDAPEYNADDLLSYEEYTALSRENQQAYYESFPSLDEYIKWYNAAKAEYESNLQKIEGGSEVNIGDYMP